MRLFLLLTFLVSVLHVSAQQDTIFKANGDQLFVHIKEVTETSVKYVFPKEDALNTVNKSSIKKISYKSGRQDFFESQLSLLDITSCLDWNKVHLSNIETEITGLRKVANLGAKAQGMTTWSSTVKLQDRAYDKIKMQAAMLGANMVYIIEQNTEEAVHGGRTGSAKLPGVTVSGSCYTSQNKSGLNINNGEYQVGQVYKLGANDFNMYELNGKDEVITVDDSNLLIENKHHKINIRVKCIRKLDQYSIIHANEKEMVLSGVFSSKNGRKTYYNIFLKRR